MGSLWGSAERSWGPATAPHHTARTPDTALKLGKRAPNHALESHRFLTLTRSRRQRIIILSHSCRSEALFLVSLLGHLIRFLSLGLFCICFFSSPGVWSLETEQSLVTWLFISSQGRRGQSVLKGFACCSLGLDTFEQIWYPFRG